MSHENFGQQDYRAKAESFLKIASQFMLGDRTIL